MNTKTILITLGIAFFVVGGMFFLNNVSSGEKTDYQASSLEDFAKCLTDSGAKFYGAKWCPHCQNQKRAFGSAVEFVPYVECSLPERGKQAKECEDAKIVSYPTWIFADGEKVVGEASFEVIGEHAGCTAPETTKI